MTTPAIQQKLIRFFANSAGALLLALASAMFLTNLASGDVTQPRDPVFMISMRNVFWIVGLVEVCVAAICLFGIRIWLKVTLVLWLAVNFLAHQAGVAWLGGNRGFSIYVASFGNAFGIEPHTAMLIARTVFAYLFIGSTVSLLWLWIEKKHYLKTASASNAEESICKS